jgi:cytochrome oxidase Cu insertion factor (SCO1/SenC/PrrC family)
MSHTTSYLAIDRDGKLRLVISHGTEPEIVAEDLRHLI